MNNTFYYLAPSVVLSLKESQLLFWEQQNATTHSLYYQITLSFGALQNKPTAGDICLLSEFCHAMNTPKLAKQKEEEREGERVGGEEGATFIPAQDSDMGFNT